MDAMEAILTRRSIRKYTSEPVTDDEVKQLLRAAMHAPSAGNQRPWEFIVIRDKETLNEITGYISTRRCSSKLRLPLSCAEM